MIKNIKTKDLALILGCTPGFISHIKTGRRKLPLKYCRKISKMFSIPLKDLRPDVYE